ncbi:MAG: hypothetical protein IPJ41_00705 [Phycisphaerales bacterium]|nr:hypothetical protein [Phycisphaerales bacterium]
MQEGTGTILGTLPPVTGETVRSTLHPDESVRWVGQPRPGAVCASHWAQGLSGLALVVFACFWGALAAMPFAGSHSTARGGVPPLVFFFFMATIGTVVLGLGLWHAATPFREASRAGKTAYVLTGRRAITVRPRLGSGWSVEAYEFPLSTRMESRIRRDGSGDLIFDRVTSGVRWGGRINGRTVFVPRGFLGVGSVAEVTGEIHRAEAAAAPAASALT